MFKEVSNGLKVKPMSVNQSYLGRKRKSSAYHAYEKYIMTQIDAQPLPSKGLLQIDFVFGVSTRSADLDNPIKPILDLLQKIHQFNDNRVYKLTAEKHIVAKGEEYLYYRIHSYVGEVNKKLEEVTNWHGL